MASNNTGTNRTPQRIIRTDIDGNTQVHSGMSGTSTSAPSGISGTRISGNYIPSPN